MDDDPSPTLTESDVFALLAHERRRFVLQLLDDFATPISTTELADLVAECERDDAAPDARRSVAVALHHVHLPKLDEAAVVTYDPADRTASPGPNFGTVVGVLTETNDAFEPAVGR